MGRKDDRMITEIENTRQLPWTSVRGYTVKDEQEAEQIADGKTAYLFRQTEDALYLFVETLDTQHKRV